MASRIVVPLAGAVLALALALPSVSQDTDIEAQMSSEGMQVADPMDPMSAPDIEDSSDLRDAPGAARRKDAQSLILGWPDGPKKAARAMIEKYGQPQETTDRMLVWHNSGPFLKTVVYRDEVPHNYPRPHADVIEQTVRLRVPADKVDELVQFDGSLIPDRTRGTLSARCDREEHNILALNIAKEIIDGTRTVDDARRFFMDTATLSMTGKSSEYLSGLRFDAADMNAADPDTPMAEGTTTP